MRPVEPRSWYGTHRIWRPWPARSRLGDGGWLGARHGRQILWAGSQPDPASLKPGTLDVHDVAMFFVRRLIFPCNMQHAKKYECYQCVPLPPFSKFRGSRSTAHRQTHYYIRRLAPARTMRHPGREISRSPSTFWRVPGNFRVPPLL